MAEQTAHTAGTGESTGADGFTPITSQDALDKIIQTRVARERARYADYDTLKDAAARLADIEESQKTETQKQADRIKTLEDQLSESVAAQARAEVAAVKGVPAALLKGTTRQELEASADQLTAWRGRPAGATSREGTTREVGRNSSLRDFAHDLFHPGE